MEEFEKNNIMEIDRYKVKKLLLQYIDLISKEYSNSKAKNAIWKINNGEEIVEYNPVNTITFYVRNGKLYLPKHAYEVFPQFSRFPNYNSKPNSHRNIADYLDTNTNYFDYIDHIIESGMSIYDYFEESLLHETMHICGSNGGYPLEEGINELKTRELAQKYNIKIAAYGYPKEVEIAKRLQEIIGKDILDELTFVPIEERKDFLTMKAGSEKANLYAQLSTKMYAKSFEYYNKMSGISDPYEKARLYDTLDYSELYSLLEEFKKNDVKQ